MTIKERIAKLIDLKSIVTLMFTLALVLLLTLPIEPNKEILALFSTSYGAITTYFFTKSDKKEENKETSK